MSRFLQWLLKSFLKGLLLVVPLTVTAWVFYYVFVRIDGLLGISIPGLGFLSTLLFIVTVGALGSIFLVDRFVAYLEHWVGRVPLAKLIYFPLKDFVGAFVGDKKSFRKPVLVALTADLEVKVVGFVTAENLGIEGNSDLVAVYLPLSYSIAGHLVLVPRSRVTLSYSIAGHLVLVPRSRVTLLPPEESTRWLAFAVSGGISRGAEISRPGH